MKIIMKKFILSCFLIVCILLSACAEKRANVYTTLGKIDVSTHYTAFHIMVPSGLPYPARYTEEYPEEYATVYALGRKSVPYILDYVEEAQISSFNAMFFVCCCYGMLDLDEWLTHLPLSDVEAHISALRQYYKKAT